MKIKILLFVLCISAFAKAQNVNIPDANWKSWLVNNTSVNTNGDTEIQVSEATAFNGTLQPIGQNISDLTGLETFVNLDRIDLDFNPLTTVDLSQNAALRIVIIADTFTMTDIILPTNTATLRTLVLNGNMLSSLDVSMYPDVAFLSVSDNQLTSLDMRNGNYQNIGPNDFAASSNPNLTCIAVDDVAYANSQWTNIDTQTSYSTNCAPPCIVNIPDAAFKSLLVNNSAINTNGDTEIQCAEASAFSGVITLFGVGISDLTGLEAFTSLTELQVIEDNINTIDVTDLVALETLVLDEINIATIDLSQNTNLTQLSLIDLPNLMSLDLSQNTQLDAIQLSQLPVTTLDFSQNVQLNTINFNQLQVTSLDFSNNPLSNVVGVSNITTLQSLDIRNGNNMALLGPNFTSLPNVTCIDVDDVAFATTNWTNVDPQISFSLDCSIPANQAPTAACQNISVSLDATGNVIIMPSDVDNGSADMDGTITLSIDQANFDCSNIGANTVVLTVTDDDGATASCTATVTIEDNTPPVITIPTSATFSNDPGSCGASVFFNLSGSDNCGTPTVTSDIAPNSFFPIGTTTVTLTADDGNGNMSTSTFTVTVNDTEDPVINIPANISVPNDTGICGAVVNYTTTATDNCATPTVIADFPSGSTFDVGVTTVTLTANDGNGNMSTSTFTVTVNDTEDPVISCPSNQTVTVNEGEQFEVPNFVSTGDVIFSDNCNGVTISQTPVVGTLLNAGNQTISLTTTDAVGNIASCSFILTVNETLSIEDNAITAFRLYPNPASSIITIDSQVEITTIEIYNLLGQQVLSSNEAIVNVEQLTAGLYIAIVQDTNGNIGTKRFIKQ